jgi:hypothetical protein
MSVVSEGRGWTPSVDRALMWASGCAAVAGRGGRVTSNEVFLGLLLAHPDPRGEMWQFLHHFGLTARDLLPDDYRVIDGAALREAAAAARRPDPGDWDGDVTSILFDAQARARGPVPVLHMMVELFTRLDWQRRLQSGLDRFGLSAGSLVGELTTIVPSLDAADEDDGVEKVDLRGATTAGEQIGQWLARRFPRRPATMASFSNDAPDPRADLIGVGPEADAFAYLIVSRTLVPPLAIGLFGHWGSGKSFLMTKIQHRVDQLTELARRNPAVSTEIWTKVAPIVFSAWQYVETDLWAALLSHVFDRLTPEARQKLTELRRRQREEGAKKDQALREQLDAEKRVDALVELEEKQAKEARAAAENLDRVKAQVATLQAAAQRSAVDEHARSSAESGVVAGIGAVAGPEVGAAIEEARRLWVVARTPVWRQSGFWKGGRAVWLGLAVFAVPALVVALGALGLGLPAALTAALVTGAGLLVPVLRPAAEFIEGRQRAALDAEQKIKDEVAGLLAEAEKKQANAEKTVNATRQELEAGRRAAMAAAAATGELERTAARLTAGTAYADFLSGRYTSDDYRKRLGIVTTISDDLKTLSDLVAAYNLTADAQDADGPPNRIVLYIDDLDRCPPARVVEVLEAVHLLLAFPLFVVVVAVDTRWLASALSHALPILKEKPVADGSAPTATDYLEKIFQIPFWVEPLDEDGRFRLLRGLLLPSVAQPVAAGSAPGGPGALRVGDREEDAARQMLAEYGSSLDPDAQRFTITPAELQFIEALNPLVAGTPRQVKRFVNVCKLLLAMAPPLAGGDGPATERTAACFLAAVHQSMPAFAATLAEAAAGATGDTTLEKLLADPVDPVDPVDTRFAGDRQRIRDWLAKLPATAAPVQPFGSVDATMLTKRWDVLRRLRFAEKEAT